MYIETEIGSVIQIPKMANFTIGGESSNNNNCDQGGDYLVERHCCDPSPFTAQKDATRRRYRMLSTQLSWMPCTGIGMPHLSLFLLLVVVVFSISKDDCAFLQPQKQLQVTVLSSSCMSVSAFTLVTPPPQSLRSNLPTVQSSSSSSSSSSTKLSLFNFGGGGNNNNNEQERTSSPDNKMVEQEDSYYEKDAVEKVFEFFFGKPEKEPFGLKRFGKERFPEQYPATIDEWADPMETDTSEMAQYRPLLKNTNLEYRSLRCTYDANQDGWSALAFHNAVDRQGGGLLVCTTRLGLVCGGYNPKGWVGYGEFRGSLAAFLFQQPIPGGGFVKLRKLGGANMAVMDNPEHGPYFGADALLIPLRNEEPKVARSRLGNYYECLPDGTKSLFGKDNVVQLCDLKVFHGVYEEGEYVPFTDAEYGLY